MKINKYVFEFVIKGVSSYGKEDIDSFDTRKEALKMLREYKMAMPEFSLSIVKRRSINPQYKEVKNEN